MANQPGFPGSDPAPGDPSVGLPRGDSPGQLEDPWSFSGPPSGSYNYGLIDPEFVTMIQAVLMSNGVDISKLSADDLNKVYIKAWQDQYIGFLWNNFAPGIPSPTGGGMSQVDYSVTQSQFLSTLSKQMFDPSSSSDTQLMTMVLGMLKGQGGQLSSSQQQFVASSTANVPSPFDAKYASQITLDYGQGWGGETEEGVDYGMPVGTMLYSPFAGTIQVEDDGKQNWGKRVFVKLDNGYTFAIGHMTQFDVTNGQRVNPGDLLGLSGGDPSDPSSGYSSGPHVEVQWIAPDGSYQNPHSIIDKIFSGTTFSAIGEAGALGSGVQTPTADELAGIDPVLKARYPGAYSLWSKYFGGTPTSNQILSLVGYGGGSMPSTTSYGAGGIDLASLARQAGFPESAIPTMVAIAMAESGGNPNAYGDVSIGGSKGLWQIYTKAHPDLDQKYNLFDPMQNALAAFQVWQNAGGSFTPWSTFNSGAYLKYMGQNPTIQTGNTSSTGTLDMTQLEDRIRSMPSHIPGMNMGQYTDMRTLADSTSQTLLGHASTDGIVQELWNSKQTAPGDVKLWYETHSPNEIDSTSYNNIVSANQGYLASIYNESGFDPRWAKSQYTPPAKQPGMPASDPAPRASGGQAAATGAAAAAGSALGVLP